MFSVFSLPLSSFCLHSDFTFNDIFAMCEEMGIGHQPIVIHTLRQ